MKNYLLACLVFCCNLHIGLCQSHYPTAIDTLFYENFDADTFDIPLGVPTGHDLGWINFDEDNTRQICFDGEDTFGWFPYFDINDTTNFTFTSCSFNRVGAVICPANKPNRNWLIMPPVFIAHENTFLAWRSLVIQGPMFHDGYRILVSTSDNFTSSFNTELFRMAENLEINPSESLDPADHMFSQGYIQADSYTKSDYYTLAIDGGGLPYNQGILEPYSVSLAGFIGQTIYLAVLHDADCDFGIQIDDLLVVEQESVGISTPIFAKAPVIYPNPAHEKAWIELEIKQPQQAQLLIYTMSGIQLCSKTVTLHGGRNTLPLQTDQFPLGIYRIVVQTPEEVVSSLLLVR